jgi:hypothetical protein
VSRYTIDIAPEFDKLLSSIADSKGTTKADIIRRAVASYQALTREVEKTPDSKVSITRNDDTVIKDVILP